MLNETDVIQSFHAFLLSCGLEIEAHQIKTTGKWERSKNNKGSYLLYLDEKPNGLAKNWANGTNQTYKWSFSKDKSAPSKDQIDIWKHAQRERISREQKEAEQKAQIAREIWATAPIVPDDGHEYLRAKTVKSYGLKLLTYQKAESFTLHPIIGAKYLRNYKNALIIPIRGIDRKIHALQLIRPKSKKPENDKAFFNSPKGRYFSIGANKTGFIVVCEGYATGATIHEATGHQVAIAFNAINLEPVATALKARFPNLKIVIGADNDHYKEQNTGLKIAKAIKEKHGIDFYLPQFSEKSNGTDFNDLSKEQGLEAVKRAFSTLK